MLPYIVTGLASGSLYALLGLGLVLTFRSTNVLNFAQGEISTLMAFICAQIAILSGIPVVWAVILSIAVAAIPGLLFYNVLFYPIRRRDMDSLAFVALSLKIAITGLVALYWGPEARVFPKLFSVDRYQIFGMYVSSGHVWMIICGIAGMIVVGAFLKFTRMGLSMRVAAENGDVAQLLGIDPRAVGTAAWIAATGLATLTGVLVASTTFLSPFMMGLVVLKVFAALVVGGMTSAVGVVIGGLLLGISEGLVAYFLTPLFQDSVGLLIIIVILLIRPQGLLGRNVQRV
jgi:branched-chain amino acid transport system permease protein